MFACRLGHFPRPTIFQIIFMHYKSIFSALLNVVCFMFNILAFALSFDVHFFAIGLCWNKYVVQQAKIFLCKSIVSRC